MTASRSRDREGALKAGLIGRSHRPEPLPVAAKNILHNFHTFPRILTTEVFMSEPVEQKSNEEQNEAIPEELTEEQLEETAGGLPHNY